MARHQGEGEVEFAPVLRKVAGAGRTRDGAGAVGAVGIDAAAQAKIAVVGDRDRKSTQALPLKPKLAKLDSSEMPRDHVGQRTKISGPALAGFPVIPRLPV